MSSASASETEPLSSEKVLEWTLKDKKRFLHAVYRVGDLDRTIKYASLMNTFFNVI